MKAKPNSKAKGKIDRISIYQKIRKPMPPPSRVTKPSGKVYKRVKRGFDSLSFCRYKVIVT